MNQTSVDGHGFRRLYCMSCGHPIDVPVYCKNRFCKFCSRARTRKIRERLKNFIERLRIQPGFGLSMLSLTIPNVADASEGARALITSFRRLRQRRRWKSLVRGGVFVIETTRSSESWHVHVHAIVEAKYFPYEELLEAWKVCSPGQGVFISRRSKQVCIRYLTKYLTKSEVPEEMQKELSDSLKSFRLFQPFGNWHNSLPPTPRSSYPCPVCGESNWLPDILIDMMKQGYKPFVATATRASP